MIYLISFLEAFCSGLTGINFVLYLKYILHLDEITAGWMISLSGFISSLFVLLFGRLIDRYGVKRCIIVGSFLLAISRLCLGLTSNLYLAIILFLVGFLGSAVKSSSISVFLKQAGKSFKLDYVIFNLAYFLAGIAFDEIKDYKLIYLVGGVFNLFNLCFLLAMQYPTFIPNHTSLDCKVLRKILAYSACMIPVSSIFIWMNTGLPKLVIAVLGKDAPVGKIYGSLNPFIILTAVPLFAYLQKRFKVSPLSYAIIGTTVSAGSLFVMMTHIGAVLPTLLTSIILFTVGEAMWSPSNMEFSSKICPKGEEGKYMTLALIPSMLSRFIYGWVISLSLNKYIYTAHQQVEMPFLIIGVLALITPIGLYIIKKTKYISFS